MTECCFSLSQWMYDYMLLLIESASAWLSAASHWVICHAVCLTFLFVVLKRRSGRNPMPSSRDACLKGASAVVAHVSNLRHCALCSPNSRGELYDNGIKSCIAKHGGYRFPGGQVAGHWSGHTHTSHWFLLPLINWYYGNKKRPLTPKCLQPTNTTTVNSILTSCSNIITLKNE